MESLPRRRILKWLGSGIAIAALPAAKTVRPTKPPQKTGFGSTTFGSNPFGA